MKIGLIWWNGQRGSKNRGHGKCFEDAGHEVIVPNNYNIYKKIYDFVFTPLTNFDSGVVPMVFQFGGYGENLIMPDMEPRFGVLGNICRKAHTMICLDPKIYYEIKYYLDQNKKIYVVPNTFLPFDNEGDNKADLDLINRIKEISKGKFIILSGSGDWDIKKPEMTIGAINNFNDLYPDIKDNYLFILTSTLENAEDIKNKYSDKLNNMSNVLILKRQTHGTMGELYKLCDIVSLFSYAEISPFVFFESVMMKKPLLVYERSLGVIQTISSEQISDVVACFGQDVRVFDKLNKDKYWSGDNKHFIKCKDTKALAENIHLLSVNKNRYNYMCEEASNWHREYNKLWNTKRRGEIIVQCFLEGEKK